MLSCIRWNLLEPDSTDAIYDWEVPAPPPQVSFSFQAPFPLTKVFCFCCLCSLAHFLNSLVPLSLVPRPCTPAALPAPLGHQHDVPCLAAACIHLPWFLKWDLSESGRGMK